MGSSGSGSFTDYSNVKKIPSVGQGGGGGASGTDKCKQAFTCVLEEVAQCDYYVATSTVPAKDSVLSISLAGRVFAVDSSGATVGALPTSFNFLASCLASGINYIGIVKKSTLTPVPTIEADFVPQEP